jgi:hypothetical protein
VIIQFKNVIGVVLVLGCLVLVGACSGESEPSDEAKVASMREALMELPYQVVLRDVETPPGARGVVTGKATDPKHDLTVTFAFILGAPEKKWLKKYVGDASGGAYNWDLDMQSAVAAPEGLTLDEQVQASEITGEVENAVCQALSGENCPI